MRSRHLKEFILEPKGQETGQNAKPRGNPLPPLLGVIKVIHAASRGTNRGTGGELSRRTTVEEG